MLELNDPLWNKLDYAHGVGGVPATLSRLAASWDDDEASEFLYGDLLHQGTCYGATYAAVPHLLKMAETTESRRRRLDIAAFLAAVARESRDRRPKFCGPADDGALQGLPETLQGWDRKRDGYRSQVALLEQPDLPYREYYDMTDLPRYKAILALEPVNAGDLKEILAIKADFISALPAIRALCERTLLENLEEPAHTTYLLTGIAAADGLLDIARLLDYGDDGSFRCRSCGWLYEFLRFGTRIAVYAVQEQPGPHSGSDNRDLDYTEGAPSRADGFMMPIDENGAVDAPIQALLLLASRSPSPTPALLVRHFAGTFRCCKCGVQGPMQGW